MITGLAKHYLALDPIWQTEFYRPCEMIPLRDHMRRVYYAAEGLLDLGHSSEWIQWQVASNYLFLAASLNDLSADTDIDGSSMWCNPAAEFEYSHSETVEKHLAGFIVFNMVWTAYEATVKVASLPYGMNEPAGARGKKLLEELIGGGHFPYLRQAVFEALILKSGFKLSDRCQREIDKLINLGFFSALGAEYLREFRNALVHGDLNKPLPTDWGGRSRFRSDDDPAIRQFHANIRVALLLIQILMRSTVNVDDELSAGLSSPQPAETLLTQLHCKLRDQNGQLELPFQDAPLIMGEDEDLFYLY